MTALTCDMTALTCDMTEFDGDGGAGADRGRWRTLEFVAGDEISIALGNAPEFESEDWPDLTGHEVVFTARRGAEEIAGTVEVLEPRRVAVEVPAAESDKTPAPSWRYDIQANIDDAGVTLARGRLNLLEGLSE